MKVLRGLGLACLLLGLVQGAQMEWKRNLNKERSPLYTRSKALNPMHKARDSIERPQLRQITEYGCFGCLANAGPNGEPVKIRAMFMDSVYASENTIAAELAQEAGTNYPCGACCTDPVLAHPACFVSDNWDSGWVAASVMQIMKNLGTEVIAMTPANFTEDTAAWATESFWLRCIWEVNAGNVDICVGDFWETRSRRAISGFTTPIDINVFKLVTNARVEDDFKLFGMTEPFRSEVWIMMWVSFAVTAVIMWIVQSEESVTDFEDDEVYPNPKGLLKSCWLAIMGYLSAHDPKYVTTSWAGRMIILGYGFFLYTSVMSYTANLASFMVLKREAKGNVESLQQVVDQGLKICVDGEMRDMVTYPGLTDDNFVKSNHFGPILEMLKADECQVGIVGKYEFRLYISGSNAEYVFCNETTDGNYMNAWFCFEPESQLAVVDLGECRCREAGLLNCPAEKQDCSDVFKFCDMIELTDPQFDSSVSVALPASDFIEPFVSAWFVKLRQDGSINGYLSSELYANNPDRCPLDSAQGSYFNEARAEALDLKAMAGTFIVSTVIIVLGLIVFAYEVWYSWKYAKDETVIEERRSAIFDESEGEKEKQDDSSVTSGHRVPAVGELSSFNRKSYTTLTELAEEEASPPPMVFKPPPRFAHAGVLSRTRSFTPKPKLGRATSLFNKSWKNSSTSFVQRSVGTVESEVDIAKREISEVKKDMRTLTNEVSDMMSILKKHMKKMSSATPEGSAKSLNFNNSGHRFPSHQSSAHSFATSDADLHIHEDSVAEWG